MRTTTWWRMVALALMTTASLAACGDDDVMEDLDTGTPPPDGGDTGIRDAGPDVRDTGLPPGQCRRTSDCPDLGFCNGEPRCMGGSTETPGYCSYPGRCYDMALSGCEQPFCNEDEDRCEISVYDGDGDGHYASECPQEPNDDCADYDPNRFPGNPEVCDSAGIDEDCDPSTLGPDRDGDGEAASTCCSTETGRCGQDCDDRDPAIGPRSTESGAATCDGADNDCDGAADPSCTCADGLADCDATPGCEVTVATDVNHCGRCGNACDPGDSCLEGVCNPAIGIAVGSQSSCALRHDGTVWCWGSNRRGQLGDGTFADRAEAAPVVGLDGVVAEIAAGGEHVCARMAEGGAVRCWGYGGHGQLGDGALITSATPVAVADLAGAVALALGRFHSCALRADGTVSCWGYNALGQLGDGTMSRRGTPVNVRGVNGARVLVAGGYQTCALAEGGLFCWGDYQGYSMPMVEPYVVDAGVLWPWEGLAAGSNHVCATDAAHTLLGCWGRNDAGELGSWYGGIPNLTTISGIDRVFAGGDLTCASALDGDVRSFSCFGLGAPLGLGLFGAGVAGYVAFLGDASSLAMSDGHACAIVRGRVACAGSNDLGQAGDESLEYRVGFDLDVLGLR